MPKTPAREGNPTRILLGYGLMYIDGVAIGLSRGGGQFTVERAYRKIAADGDRGGYKGRITVDESIPKLKLNVLEIIGSNLAKLYPAISDTSTTSNGVTTHTVTGTGKIDDTADYHTVRWVGKTKDEKAVEIIVENAINLDNLDWNLVDKDEVVPSVTYEGTYPEDHEEGYEPWEVTYVESASN